MPAEKSALIPLITNIRAALGYVRVVAKQSLASDPGRAF
jgi:hypothetical protein